MSRNDLFTYDSEILTFKNLELHQDIMIHDCPNAENMTPGLKPRVFTNFNAFQFLKFFGY